MFEVWIPSKKTDICIEFSMEKEIVKDLKPYNRFIPNLEADLWKWRTKCRASGKKIPKRLVQARAKWAFQKQGISEFKVGRPYQIMDALLFTHLILTKTILL